MQANRSTLFPLWSSAAVSNQHWLANPYTRHPWGSSEYSPRSEGTGGSMSSWLAGPSNNGHLNPYARHPNGPPSGSWQQPWGQQGHSQQSYLLQPVADSPALSVSPQGSGAGHDSNGPNGFPARRPVKSLLCSV